MAEDYSQTLKAISDQVSMSASVAQSALSSIKDSGLKEKLESYFGSLKSTGDLLKDNKGAEALDLMNKTLKDQKALILEVQQASGLSSQSQKDLVKGLKDVGFETKSFKDGLDGTKQKMKEMKETLASFNQIGGALNKTFGDSFTAASAMKGVMAGLSFSQGNWKDGALQTIEATNMMVEGISRVQIGFRETALAIVASGVSKEIQNDMDKVKGYISSTVGYMNYNYGVTAEETEKIMSELASSGFKKLDTEMVSNTRDLFLMSKALNMSTGEVSSLSGLLMKTFKMDFTESKKTILAVAEASEKANVSQAEYVKSIISAAENLQIYNVSVKDVNAEVKKGIDAGMSWSRALASASEMVSGLAKQDLGRRAFAAQSAGFGRGDVLGAAAMAKYEGSPGDTEKYMSEMLKRVGGGLSETDLKTMMGGGRESKEKAFGAAQKVALASGLDERVVMEKLLGVTTKKDPMESAAESLKQMGPAYSKALTADENMKKLGRLADYAISGIGIPVTESDKKAMESQKKVFDLMTQEQKKKQEIENVKSGKDWGANILSIVGQTPEQAVREKELELTKIQSLKTEEEKRLRSRMTKHSGGEIKFHNGDEVDATLLTGEGVLNRMAMQAAKSNYGNNFLDNMNQGKMPSGGGGGIINVNVDPNFAQLKKYINMWIQEVFRDGMKAVI
jgi:hypothetical protein